MSMNDYSKYYEVVENIICKSLNQIAVDIFA